MGQRGKEVEGGAGRDGRTDRQAIPNDSLHGIRECQQSFINTFRSMNYIAKKHKEHDVRQV